MSQAVRWIIKSRPGTRGYLDLNVTSRYDDGNIFLRGGKRRFVWRFDVYLATEFEEKLVADDVAKQVGGSAECSPMTAKP